MLKTYLVTGANGLLGRELIAKLVKSDEARVVALDIMFDDQENEQQNTQVSKVVCDIRNFPELLNIMQGVNTVFHCAALCGPYYPNEMYYGVNFLGTRNILSAMVIVNAFNLIYIGTPATRYTGEDMFYADIDEMFFPAKKLLHEYATTKSFSEYIVKYQPGYRWGVWNLLDGTPDSIKYKTENNGVVPTTQTLASSIEYMTQRQNRKIPLTICLMPHQIYGPRDKLFLPGFMSVAKNQRLRVLGSGINRVSMVSINNFVDSLLHADCRLNDEFERSVNFFKDLLSTLRTVIKHDLSLESLKSLNQTQQYSDFDAKPIDLFPFPDNPAIFNQRIQRLLGTEHTSLVGESIIVVDGDSCDFWTLLAEASIDLGFGDFRKKMRVPTVILYIVGYLCAVYSYVTSCVLKLTPLTAYLISTNRVYVENALCRCLSHH